MKRVFKILFLLIGVLLLAYVLNSVGLKDVGHSFTQIDGWGWWVLAFYPLMCVWDVWGWHVVLRGMAKSVSFWELFGIRLAGESINNTTPFADMGGEYIKIALCAKRFGFTRRLTFASVIIERTALFITEIAFWGVGLLPLILWLPVAQEFKNGLMIAAVLCIGLVGCVLWIQKRGMFGAILRWTERFEIRNTHFQKMNVALNDVDGVLQSFHREKRSAWYSTLSLHFVGWVMGGFEMFIMLRVLGVEATLIQAFVLEALLHLIRTSSFFIPGNLGALEGALALVMHGLGFNPALGVALGFLKRLRQIVWTGVGFGAWGLLAKLPALQSVESLNPNGAYVRSQS